MVDDNRDAADSSQQVAQYRWSRSPGRLHRRRSAGAARNLQPAVLLVDIGMPDMDGYELARRVRQSPKYHDMTLIALTGWGQEEDRRRSQAAGFNFHLTKPADFNTLQSLLGSLQSPEGSLTRH